MRRALRSPVIAYCIVAMGFAAGIVHTQQVARQTCHASQRSWDAATAIIQAQTTRSQSVTSDTNLAAQIASGNARKTRQRLELTAQLGKRPSC